MDLSYQSSSKGQSCWPEVENNLWGERRKIHSIFFSLSILLEAVGQIIKHLKWHYSIRKVKNRTAPPNTLTKSKLVTVFTLKCFSSCKLSLYCAFLRSRGFARFYPVCRPDTYFCPLHSSNFFCLGITLLVRFYACQIV